MPREFDWSAHQAVYQEMVCRSPFFRLPLPFLGAAVLALPVAAVAQGAAPRGEFAAAAAAVQPRVVQWRRQIHANPELGNREFETAKLVAAELRRLGLKVRTGVAHTGVVAVLEGAKPGPVVALRADMDALPVLEKTSLPFASKRTAELNGRTVPVMHACGHDAHVAMLLGAANILAGQRNRLAGTVLFLFQPAEESFPDGEEGGAALMVKEGALTPKPDAIFALHVSPREPGHLFFRAGSYYAASDRFKVVLRGRQTHGAVPWRGIDIASLAALVIGEFNQIAARQVDVTNAPTVLTVASIHAGLSYNVIPEQLEMTGTLRTFEAEQRAGILDRMKRLLQGAAAAYGATAELIVDDHQPVTFNDPALVARMTPSLIDVFGREQVHSDARRVTGAEDFPAYTRDVPGFYLQLGVRPKGVSAEDAAPNHSPYFDLDEASLQNGVLAFVSLATEFLKGGAAR